MSVCELRTSRPRRLVMQKNEKESPKAKTPIERTFYAVFKREMTAKERRILLRIPKQPPKQNRTARDKP
jgi:hypothetical protein